MKRFGSLFPFLEQGPRHAPIGRLVANAGFARALLQYGRFDEYVFGSPSRSNIADFKEAVATWDTAGRSIRYADYAEWPAMLRADTFHVVHLGGWGHFMPGLHYLRGRLAPRVWPITGIIHSLHGRETIDHAVRLASAELLPCDAIFCTSRDGHTALERLLEGAAAIVGRRFRGQLLHAPLGVPDELIDRPGDRQQARQRLRIPEEAVVALVLGRLSVSQKMDLGPLCRVFARSVLPRVGQHAILVFAGGASPAELELLRATVKHHGLDAHVRLQANFNPEQKGDVLAMADVLVAPSDNAQETFGLSVVEGQAAGLPVIASRYDGYKDLVMDGIDGFLVDTWAAPVDPLADWFDLMDGTVAQLVYAQGIALDLDQLADRLLLLLTDAGLRRRLGAAGREKVDRRYRWSRVIAGYEATWNDLAREASACALPAAASNPFALDGSTVFGHYASGRLAADTVVVAAADRLDEMPYRDTAGWLAPPLLHGMLRAAARPIAAGILVAGADVPPGQGWFAVAWLLKYGLLRRVLPGGNPGTP
jgi:glycosyltransferase involved in cell wall biosynthesis